MSESDKKKKKDSKSLSRSRFYVETPSAPSMRHSMFVSQSELDKRQPPPSPTTSTLPSSSGSVDRLTGVGEKKKKHRFSFANLRSGSTLSLRPLFSVGSLRRRKSVDARRDSYSQTEEGVTVARGVQTQSAPTVDVPVQTCFEAWDGTRSFFGIDRTSTSRSNGPAVGLSARSNEIPAYRSSLFKPQDRQIPQSSLVTEDPASLTRTKAPPTLNTTSATVDISSIDNSAPKSVNSEDVPSGASNEPKRLATTDSIVSLYDEPSSVSNCETSVEKATSNSPHLIENRPSEIPALSSPESEDKVSKVPFGKNSTIVTTSPSRPVSQESPRSSDILKSSSEEKTSTPERCPSRGKTVQFILSDPDPSESAPKIPRNVDAEFEALLRDLDIISDCAEELNVKQFPDKNSFPKTVSAIPVKPAFEVLLRHDLLDPIPENNESLNGAVEDYAISTRANLSEVPSSPESFLKLKSDTESINQNRPSGGSVKSPGSTGHSDRNSSEGIATASVETLEPLTPTKLDISVICPTASSACIYEPEIKEETKHTAEKTVIMPTLPSFFDSQPKCGSPDDTGSMHAVRFPDYDASQQAGLRRSSVVSVESESENKSKYSRSNSCNSTRSTTLSGFDTFYESSVKFDSSENLERLEDEIIRSLCSPVHDLEEQKDECEHVGSIDKVASDKRRAILDRLLSGACVEEPVFSHSNSEDTGKKLNTPQKFTATLTKIQHVDDDVPGIEGTYNTIFKDKAHVYDTFSRDDKDQPIPAAIYRAHIDIESPKKTSMFVFPEVKPSSDKVSVTSTVEVQVPQTPTGLEVRRSSWSVPSQDPRVSPAKSPSVQNMVDANKPEIIQGGCEYTNCLKPSQMQNSSFLAEIGPRSFTPRPGSSRSDRETTPSRVDAPSTPNKQQSTVNCDYESCLKPSEVHNSLFTVELSEFTRSHPVKRSPSPRPPVKTNYQEIKTSRVDEFSDCETEKEVEFVKPEVKVKSELRITLKSPENTTLEPSSSRPLGGTTDAPLPIASPPPPPPPPPQKSSGTVINEYQNSPLSTMIKDQQSKLAPLEAKSYAPPKSPMMVELQRKFESRAKTIETPDESVNRNSEDERNASRSYHDTSPVVSDGDYNPNSVNGNNTSWQNTSPVTNGNRLQNGNNAVLSNREHRSPLSLSPDNNYHPECHNGQSHMHFSPATIITDEPPPPGAVLVDQKVTVEGDKIHTDKYYTLPVKEILTEKSTTTKFIPAPPKYEGIGPTEEGIPTALRQSVKHENKHNWYKTMYKSLHKADENSDDTYVIGYTSEPEMKKDITIRKKSATLDNRHSNDNKLYNTHLPKEYPPSAKCTIDVYNVRPRLIEDYEPGQSSVTDNSILSGSKRFLPPLNAPKPSYEFKKGYESDTSLTRNLQPEGLNPEQQKQWYRQIQLGGDIPQFGLGKVIPDKPKEPVVGPPPPPPLHYPKQPMYQEAVRPLTLPPEYVNQNGNGVCQQPNGLYETHMRQAIHSEMQQRMSPSSQQLSPPSRSLSKSPCRSPEIRTPARALFDFNAESHRELSLRKGDFVLILRQLDKNWYQGEKKGIVGIFPVNYVEIIPPEHLSYTAKSSVEGIGKVLYDFNAQTAVELTVRKGDPVSLIRRVDVNWFEARMGNKKGILPVSYIQVLQQPSGTNANSPSPKPMTNSSRSKSASNERIQSPTAVSPMYSPHSPNSQHIPDPRSKLQNRPKKGNSLIEPVLYRAVYSYNPQNSDEMELLEGDTVYVVEMCDDGWYVGTSVRTGVFGIFPGNYVEKA